MVISAVTYRRRHLDSRKEIVRKKSKRLMIRFQLGSCSSLDVSLVCSEMLKVGHKLSIIFFVLLNLYCG